MCERREKNGAQENKMRNFPFFFLSHTLFFSPYKSNDDDDNNNEATKNAREQFMHKSGDAVIRWLSFGKNFDGVMKNQLCVCCLSASVSGVWQRRRQRQRNDYIDTKIITPKTLGMENYGRTLLVVHERIQTMFGWQIEFNLDFIQIGIFGARVLVYPSTYF